MNIPFVDLKAQYQSLKPKMDEAIQGILDNASFIGGKPVTSFEEQFANLYGVKHCISTANGTDSLYIIMRALGIGPGDEVITTAHSWISSSETISQTGAKVVFVDTEPGYYTIDPNLIRSKISEKTKAIMPVHLYGQVCDMDAIRAIAVEYNLQIIEDCAQSHFSEFKGERAGTMGVAGSFSFFPGKNLGAYGDAGGIITNDDELATKCRLFARHGALKKHEHQIEGINSRLDALQAAILSVKLPHILDWINARGEKASYYTEGLKNLESVELPTIRNNSKHSFHLYVIKVDNRDQLQAYLKENGIETGIHYPSSLPLLKAYSDRGYKHSDFPDAYGNSQRILSLPIYPEITKEQQDYVISKLQEFYGE